MSYDHILKCRDDKAPVFLTTGGTDEEKFQLAEGGDCSWLSKDEKATPEKLRLRIEPWLTALFQSEHLSLLAGSGLTHATYSLATKNKLPGLKPGKFSEYDDEINTEANRSAKATGRGDGNLEDQLRVANELLRGLEILNRGDASKTNASKLAQNISTILRDFADSILVGENGLAIADSRLRENALNYLVSFLMSFASRTVILPKNWARC